MPLFETIRGQTLGGLGPQYAITPEQQMANLRRNLGDETLGEAGLLRRLAAAPDDGRAEELLQAIRLLGGAGTGQDGIDSGLFPQNLGPQAELLRGALARLPQAAEAPAAPAAPTVPGAPALGRGIWEGNTFLPPTDPPRPGTGYPQRSPEGFLPGRVPAAIRAPALPDHYGGGLLQQMRAARPRLLAR